MGTGRKVNVNSKLGKKIIKNYLYQLGGAGESSPPERVRGGEPTASHPSALAYATNILETYRTQYLPHIINCTELIANTLMEGEDIFGLSTNSEYLSYLFKKNNCFLVIVGEVHELNSVCNMAWETGLREKLVDEEQIGIGAQAVARAVGESIANPDVARIAAFELPILDSFDTDQRTINETDNPYFTGDCESPDVPDHQRSPHGLAVVGSRAGRQVDSGVSVRPDIWQASINEQLME